MIFYGVNNDIYGNEFDNLVTEFSDMDASVIATIQIILGNE